MPPGHLRLENALVRAEELITVGQNSTALQLLHDAVMSKWYQHNLLSLEAIMLKFVELCVNLRRGRTVKDGLHQYRGVCQNLNIQGLEVVIKRFLELGEKKLSDAREQAAKLALDQIDDLESENHIPNFEWTGILPEDAKDRTDREIVTPWLRFVWESYRVVLDICRHNARLEPLYREIVERAFTFCRNYQRKAEFRRLCEILRHHLTLIVRYTNQNNGVSLSNSESHQLQLDIRFGQLQLATEMELWQEAFRSIEDIHGLFVITRKSIKPAIVVSYYEKLCRVFLMSENYLFLAAAWHKLFVVAKAHGKESDDHSSTATMVLIATLAIPCVRELCITSTLSSEEVDGRSARLAQFLGLSKVPTRKSLLRDIITKGILSFVPPELAELYQLVEAKVMDPLTISNQVIPYLKKLEGSLELSKFVGPIINNVAARVIFKVSLAYTSITLSHLEELLDFSSFKSVSFDLKRFLLNGCRVGDFFLRIDHIGGFVKFERPCFDYESFKLNDGSQDNVFNNLLTEINKILVVLEPEFSRFPNAADRIANCLSKKQAEYKENLGRKIMIEKKKERYEILLQQKERDEARERAIRHQQEQELEKMRIAEEASRREKQRLEEDRENIRREQAQKREEEISRIKELAARRLDQEKLQTTTKRLDHLERALRQEEIPLLEKDFSEQKQKDLQAHDERVRLVRENALTRYNTDVEIKNKLKTMTDDYGIFLTRIKENRMSFYKKELERQTEALEKLKTTYREEAIAEYKKKKELEAERERYWLERKAEDEKRQDDMEMMMQEREGLERAAEEKRQMMAERQTSEQANKGAETYRVRRGPSMEGPAKDDKPSAFGGFKSRAPISSSSGGGGSGFGSGGFKSSSSASQPEGSWRRN